MAAHLAGYQEPEPDGHRAGRVTVTGLAVSLVPPVVTVAVLIVLALLELISHEVAGAAALAVLANAGLTSSSVFAVQKRTPTDQGRTAVTYVPQDVVAHVPERLSETPPAGGSTVAEQDLTDDPQRDALLARLDGAK